MQSSMRIVRQVRASQVRRCSSLGSMYVQPGDKIGPMLHDRPGGNGGQIKKGPFFCGDATYPPQLAPIEAKGSTGVGSVLDELQARTPLNTAFKSDNITWTFTDVKNHCDALARGLQELGLKKGAEVSVNMDNISGMVVTLAGEKLGLKVTSSQAVPAAAVGTPSGVFNIADISVYNSTEVGAAGSGAKKVVSGASGKAGELLKQVFSSVL